MDNSRVLILGGYGNTGRLVAQLLLEQTETCLILAGRNLDRAETAAAQFNARFGGQRVRALAVDASDEDSLRLACGDADLLVAASSTSEHAAKVARAALQAHTDYLDVQYSSAKLRALLAMREEIAAAGRCFISEGGFHPGLPAAMVRYAAHKFDRLEEAIVGSVIKIDWAKLNVSDETVDELVGEFMSFQALVYRDGSWQEAGMRAMIAPLRMDFGAPFGRQYCVPMFLEEMRPLPEMYPGLRQVGFFVGGFNWFVDWIISPLALAAVKISPEKMLRPMGRWMRWGLNKFSKPPYGTLLRAEVRGGRDGKACQYNLTISHADGYALTAIPVVACLLQCLDGSIRKPGLWLQAHIVEPVRLMEDMKRMGVTMVELLID